MNIVSLQTTNGMMVITLTFGPLGNMTSPRQAVTTTNLNHSDTPNYKTNFYELLLESIDKDGFHYLIKRPRKDH